MDTTYHLYEAFKGMLLAVHANCKLVYKGVTSTSTLGFFFARKKLYNIKTKFQWCSEQKDQNV